MPTRFVGILFVAALTVRSIMDKFPITQRGFAAMEIELKHLKTVERPNVIKAIAEARAHGDLSENAEYDAAREKQSFIEGRILELAARISGAEVIDVAAMSGDQVKFGATVVLLDEDTEEKVTYQIVGEYEADLKKFMLSNTAPLSRALMGKKKGDSVEVHTPKGTRIYEIVQVAFK
jgi:transcription elongation factor GreA